MLKFPKGAVASCAGESLADQECVVSLRLADDFDRIDEYKKLYGKRILFFETEGRNLSAGGALEALAGERVRICAKKSDIAFIGEAHDRFVTMKPVFLVEPGDDLFRMVNFLSGFGFRVHISPAVPVGNPERLERVLDFYFHSPLVSAPIEPFHTLLHTEVKKRRVTLWDTEYERVGNNFHISDSGEVSLSKRWHAAGRSYGQVEEPWDDIVESDIFQRQRAYTAELLKSRNECAFCAHFSFCGGFLRAIEPEWDCGPWKRVFDTIVSEVSNSKELLSNYDAAGK